MKILDKKHTLKKQLSSYADANIVIVSAFVSGILDHLKKLIKKNTHISLYTGILNGFNNPRELEDIANLAKKNKKFDFYVNFNKKDKHSLETVSYCSFYSNFRIGELYQHRSRNNS